MADTKILPRQLPANSTPPSGAVTIVDDGTSVNKTTLAQLGDAIGAVRSIVPGVNVNIDNTDPLNPVISATNADDMLIPIYDPQLISADVFDMQNMTDGSTKVAMTIAERSKLSGIESGAQVNTVNTVAGKTGAVTLVKGDVGLGSVENLTPADMPISTLTQTALNGKFNNPIGTTAQYVRGDGSLANLPDADVGIYNSVSVVESTNISPSLNAIRLNGNADLGDGLGGLYVDIDNGSTDTIVSGDGRTWYRVRDVGEDRISSSVYESYGSAFYKNRYKKRIVANIPSAPPTYQQVLDIETDSTSFIAQGMCLDPVDNKLYIIMSSPGTGKNMWVFVYEWGTWEYVNTFGLKLTGVTGGEGIEVIRDGTNRYVYARTINNGVERFDITSLPASMSILTAESTYMNGAGGQISHRYGQWLVHQWVGANGGVVRNDQFHLLDNDLVTIRSVKTFQPFDVGYITAGEAQSATPKIQGMILGDGIMFAPMGGAAGITGDQDGYGFCGVRVFNTQAECISDNLISPSKFAQKLISLGHFCNRMEYEGGFQDQDGKIFTLAVTVSPSRPEAVDGGMIIFEEYSSSPDAVDFRDCAQSLKIPSFLRLTSGVFPVSQGGVMRNPINGLVLDSWDKMMSMMSDLGLPRLAYFTSIIQGTTDLSNNPLVPSAYVEIVTANEDTFIVTVTVNGFRYMVRAFGTEGSRTFSTFSMPLNKQVGLTVEQVTSGRVWHPNDGDHIHVANNLNSEGSITLQKVGSVQGSIVEIKRGTGSGNLLIRNSTGSVIQTLVANQVGKVIMGGSDWYSWSVITV